MTCKSKVSIQFAANTSCCGLTFNNISVTSWGSVLFVEETRAPRENHQSVTSHSHTIALVNISPAKIHIQKSYDVRNPGHGLGQAQTLCRVKPVNGDVSLTPFATTVN